MMHPVTYTCTKCGKTFLRMEGGIVADPGININDRLNPVCDSCRLKKLKELFKK